MKAILLKLLEAAAKLLDTNKDGKVSADEAIGAVSAIGGAYHSVLAAVKDRKVVKADGTPLTEAEFDAAWFNALAKSAQLRSEAEASLASRANA